MVEWMKIFTWMKNEKQNVGKVGLEPNLCPRFEKKKKKLKTKREAQIGTPKTPGTRTSIRA
jgi:hypothetical protein